jgi:Bacterial EndoU nuclease
MALDRPDDDFEAGEARLEQHLRSHGSNGDVPAPRSEPAEPRTREEYYEALRAADNGSDGEKPTEDSPGDDKPDDHSAVDDKLADDKPEGDGPADGSHVADSRTERSGWDSVDERNRPPVDDIRVSPERRGHILDGEADGSGGHRHGTGNPGKTEFPASWNDEQIIDALLDVARRPDHPPRQQERNDRWVTRGTRDDVEVVAVIAPDGRIWTGWPTPGGPGVVKNPKER